MIVGMSIGDFVLVASDRRQVCMINGVVDHVESDSVNKIIECPIGFITGNGYVPLLNEFKNELKHRTIENTNEIQEIASELSRRIPPGLEEWEQRTNWMFTYVAATDMGNIPRIAIVEAKDYSKIRILNDMSATIWAKLPNLSERINELNSKLRSVSEFLSIELAVSHHVSLLKELFEYGEEVDPTVCSEFDVCIQLQDGTKCRWLA